MKRYIKPNTNIFFVKLENQLLTISGDAYEKRGSYNGEYGAGVTLGSRQGSFWDEDFDEDDEEDF
jgi:hypothetical protein